MKAMFLGFAAIIIIAVGANLALGQLGFSSADQMSSSSTRLN